MTDSEEDPLDEFVDGMAEEAGEGDRFPGAVIEMDGTIYSGGEEISREELNRRLEEAPPSPPGEVQIIDFRTEKQRERDRREADD